MLADFPRSVVDEARPLATREDRKVAGVCTYDGCGEDADDESVECPKHRRKSARRKARWRKAKRKLARKLLAKRIQKKLCMRCGRKRLSGHDHCAKCFIAIGEGVHVVCPKNGDKKSARITANTSIDADGRSRYRGQGKRGQPKRGAIDAKDLGYALDALGRGVKGLAFADALEGTALTKAQRVEARGEALAQLDQAQRFIEDVLDRHGYFGKTDPDE